MAQYPHVLRDIMVPSVQEMYPDGVINFQQDQSPIHKSQLLQGWLADQNEVKLLDWPPCGADLKPIKNVWAETKRVMAENWPDPSPASKNALWDVVLDAWKEVAYSEVYAATLVESLPWRMQMEQLNVPFLNILKVNGSCPAINFTLSINHSRMKKGVS
jgi:hypothetical protein